MKPWVYSSAIGVVSIAIIATVVLTDWNNLNVTTGSEFEIFKSQIATAEGAPTCNINYTEVQESFNMGLKLPKWLSEGYSVHDVFTTPGAISFYYATKPLCGEGENRATPEDVIEYHTASEKSHKSNEIQLGEKYFDDFQSISSLEGIQRFTVDGKPAMGWEITTGESITMWENGTVIDSQRVPRPAELTIIDPTEKTFTIIRGWVPLDVLKKMAESIS